MQKIIFLFEQEIGKDTGLYEYQFQAANFGPFSWRLSNALDFLVSNGLVEETKKPYGDAEKYEYSLTEEGVRAVKEAIAEDGRYSKYLRKMEELKVKYNDMGLRTLLMDIYSRFPDYAAKSQYEF
jgi:uncharacterized protein YwgA